MTDGSQGRDPSGATRSIAGWPGFRQARRVLRATRTAVGQSTERLARDAQAFWSASRDSDYQRDQSHWLGQGRWSDEQKWLGIGQRSHDLMLKAAALAGVEAAPRRVLEWGPGGGANAVRFAGEVEAYYGVDISAPNLEECARQIESRGHACFRPLLIDADRPEGVLDQVSKPIDFFLSTAVFQHFPGKAYGERVVGIVARLLAPGGLAVIQIRYDDGRAAYQPKRVDYWRNAITFTSYRVEEFWRILADAGLRPLSVSLNPAVNYATYLIAAPAGPPADGSEARGPEAS